MNLIAGEIAGWFPASSTTGDIYDFIQHGADVELAKVVRDAIQPASRSDVRRGTTRV